MLVGTGFLCFLYCTLIPRRGLTWSKHSKFAKRRWKPGSYLTRALIYETSWILNGLIKGSLPELPTTLLESLASRLDEVPSACRSMSSGAHQCAFQGSKPIFCPSFVGSSQFGQSLVTSGSDKGHMGHLSMLQGQCVLGLERNLCSTAPPQPAWLVPTRFCCKHRLSYQYQ